VLAAIVAGAVLAIVLSGDDDGDKSSASAPTATETSTTETATERTDTTTTETSQGQQQQDEQQIEQTITTFVESAEQSDSQACSQVAGGAGRRLEDCAAAAGIDLRTLPSSDEFQIDDVRISGNRAEAKLSNGSSFSLKQSGGSWKISGFRPQRQVGPGSGGQRAPGE
jgi:redox-regulated HSP33 family molecular chaperone